MCVRERGGTEEEGGDKQREREKGRRRENPYIVTSIEENEIKTLNLFYCNYFLFHFTLVEIKSQRKKSGFINEVFFLSLMKEFTRPIPSSLSNNLQTFKHLLKIN